MNAHSQPLVSIITPIHNSEKTLLRTIESIQNQREKHWELHLIDNLSTDNSLAIAQNAAKNDPRIFVHTYTEKPSAGMARNVGITAAQGQFIAFLDSDDTWEPEKLATQIEYMQDNHLAMSWTAYRVVTPQKTYNRLLEDYHTSKDLLSKRATIGCLTVVYDTAQTGKHFMLDVQKRQDFILFVTLLRYIEHKGQKAKGLNTILATYYTDPNSLSGNKKSAAKYQWIALRNHLNLSLPESIAYFAQYALRGVLDKFAKTPIQKETTP